MSDINLTYSLWNQSKFRLSEGREVPLARLDRREDPDADHRDAHDAKLAPLETEHLNQDQQQNREAGGECEKGATPDPLGGGIPIVRCVSHDPTVRHGA